MEKIKVLVVGESCEDKFVYTKVSRLSPEAPVPVLVPIRYTQNRGMSGNVVENLKSILLNLDIFHWTQSQTITKTRFIEDKSNHMFLRLDEGDQYITPINQSLLDNEKIKEYDIVVVSDYNKGFLRDEDLVFIGENSKLSIIDSKRRLTERVVKSFSFVKINEEESIQNKHISDNNNIIITLGSKGAKFNNQIYPSPSPKETIDVSGAGDTFTASFILKYYETRDISKSIVFANQMCSIVVSKRGVVTPLTL